MLNIFTYLFISSFFSDIRPYTKTIDKNQSGDYFCNMCSYKFHTLSENARHILECHTVERHPQCYICSKSFNHKSNLVIHMRTHTGERPFACPHCPKKFNQKSNLTVHMRKHNRDDEGSQNFYQGPQNLFMFQWTLIFTLCKKMSLTYREKLLIYTVINDTCRYRDFKNSLNYVNK